MRCESRRGVGALISRPCACRRCAVRGCEDGRRTLYRLILAACDVEEPAKSGGRASDSQSRTSPTFFLLGTSSSCGGAGRPERPGEVSSLGRQAGDRGSTRATHHLCRRIHVRPQVGLLVAGGACCERGERDGGGRGVSSAGGSDGRVELAALAVERQRDAPCDAVSFLRRGAGTAAALPLRFSFARALALAGGLGRSSSLESRISSTSESSSITSTLRLPLAWDELAAGWDLLNGAADAEALNEPNDSYAERGGQVSAGRAKGRRGAAG